MSAAAENGWKVKATGPPRLTNNQWALSSLLGLVLLVMAVLQLISFSDFRDILATNGLSGQTAWAVAAVVGELWGAACLFKVPLSRAFRWVSASLLLLVSLFWFVETAQLVAGGSAGLGNVGYFGRFLAQTPGWWTVVEASAFLFLALYVLGLSKASWAMPASWSTKRR